MLNLNAAVYCYYCLWSAVSEFANTHKSTIVKRISLHTDFSNTHYLNNVNVKNYFFNF